MSVKYDCVAIVRPIISMRFPYESLPAQPRWQLNILSAALTMKMPELFKLVSFALVIHDKPPKGWLAVYLEQEQVMLEISNALIGPLRSLR